MTAMKIQNREVSVHNCFLKWCDACAKFRDCAPPENKPLTTLAQVRHHCWMMGFEAMNCGF